jgi:putative membrane protein
MKKLPIVLFGLYIPVLAFSMVDPFSWANWIAEITPVLAAVALLILTFKKHRLSNFAYLLAAIWIFMHTIGAKYSFALVPIDLFDETRNHFDRVAHFAIGFWAVAIAEWAVMNNWVKTKSIAALFGVLAIMSVAAGYEIIEWAYAELAASGASDFLGSQGDIWDAQKDMLADTLGAVSSVLVWLGIKKK